MAQQKKPYECFACKNNGFPNEMVLLAGRDDRGNPIRKNLDESPHTHKTKLAGKRSYPSGDITMPMDQFREFTSAAAAAANKTNKTKDEQISQYHAENREDREAYRQLQRELIESNLEIARALNKLAAAISERGEGDVPKEFSAQ